jgi:enterochelin esterase family protein
VTFRLRAPRAERVSVFLDGQPPLALHDEGGGAFVVTTAPLAPDIYGYSFETDGVRGLDPSNPAVVPNLLEPRSTVQVRGPVAQPWDATDVPHGALHRHFFRSVVVGDAREFYVYTPPGYDPTEARTYPVLYLLHGFSDDASAWTAVGRAHVILDNLIAAKQATPMVVVMPLGYGAPEILSGGFAGFGRDRDVLQRNFDRFGESLLGEVVPRAEEAYRIATDRSGRAIAGLSMGGAEALLVGLNHPDLFGWVGGFSAAALDDFAHEFPGVDRRTGDQLHLLWIACGVDDKLVGGLRALDAWLQAKRAIHTAVETPGGHTWPVWRRNLVAFASLLFREPGNAPPMATHDGHTER